MTDVDKRIRFAELVDLDDLDALMANFNEVIGIANAVIDVDGVVITQSGWQEACTQYHRVNPVTCERCIQSDTSLVESLTKGMPFAVYRCLNGLVDTASPIVVDGQHVANVFTGQFFTAPPDLAFFRQQAREFGFDETKYLDAIGKVPIVPMERVEAITRFYANIARMLASHGLDHLRQQQSEAKLEQLNRELLLGVEERTRELSEKNQLLLAVLDAIPSLVFWKDNNLHYLGCNRQFAHDSGFGSPDDIIGLTDDDLSWADKADLYQSDDREVMRLDEPKLHYEETSLRPDGSMGYASISKVPLHDAKGNVIGLLGAYEDITERKQAELREQLRSRALELMASNASLANILQAIVLGAEQGTPGWRCSILLLDGSGRHLGIGAAPNLPDFYNAAIDGVEIGPAVGSCGTAAYTGKRIVVEDIQTHPYWEPYKDLAAKAGLRACWSEPIMSGMGTVLGTFAIYHRKPKLPSAADERMIEQAAYLAGIAIERCSAADELRVKTEAMQRSNADLEQFAYSVSHDMRQPLRMVSGHLQLLAGSLKDTLQEDDLTNLNFALDGARRMDAMIVSLLEYSRVGRLTRPMEWLLSREPLDEAVAFLTPAIEESGAAVTIAGEWPRVFASRDELTRLFQNLIGNALHYRKTDDPPRIDVDSVVERGIWCVRVRDQGIGIDPQQIERLFKFFSRLQSRARFEGTGMGLALCRRIVEHHGGSIRVESEGEGTGSTFIFEIPLNAEQPADAARD